jgi:dolichyl-diphosphooligosaccharide--protein glycosyltransferase
MALRLMFEWAFGALLSSSPKSEGSATGTDAAAAGKEDIKPAPKEKPAKKAGNVGDFMGQITNFFDEQPMLKTFVAITIIVVFGLGLWSFWGHSWMMSEHLSSPQIMVRACVLATLFFCISYMCARFCIYYQQLKGRNRDGSEVMIDDFRESYWWLRDNTPEDARIMAWWGASGLLLV